MPEPVRTYYRSRTPDGMIWCESRDPDEVRRMRHPVLPVTLERMDVYEFTPGWRTWSPSESVVDPDLPRLAPPRRLKSCVEQWPDCQEGEYNPRCCRFPKSCSCTVYHGSNPDEDLEPPR
jgi:hypothetical protein